MILTNIFENPIETINLNSSSEKELILEHLKDLDRESKELRFCGNVSDYSIEKYVESLEKKRDFTYGIFDDSFVNPFGKSYLIAFGHLAKLQKEDEFELALSVSPLYREKGLGKKLLEDLLFVRAKNLKAKSIHCECLYVNKKIQSLFEKKGVELDKSSKDYVQGRIYLDGQGDINSHLQENYANILELQKRITRTGREFLTVSLFNKLN